MAWADELSTVLFIWLIFWANAFLLPDRKQIAFDLLYRNVPPALASARDDGGAGWLVVGGLFAWALPGVVDYLCISCGASGRRCCSGGWTWVYACFGMFVLAVVVRAGLGLYSTVSTGRIRA